jgi:predicted enzyme related to lactoylglutathione lyase
MSERTSYAPGTPCWVDLATPDLEAAEKFYGPLFGWAIPELPNSAEMGGYRRAKKGGRDVAGAMPLMQEGQPPAWSTYVSVDDADAIARAVQENGGTMIAEPMEVASYGRLAMFTDPEGAFFGWEFDEESMGEKVYNVARVGEARVAGMADISGRMPDEIPAHWMTYFCVESADGAIEKVESGGGAVQFGPIDMSVGRFAMVTDPAGAAFAVINFADDIEVP